MYEVGVLEAQSRRWLLACRAGEKIDFTATMLEARRFFLAAVVHSKVELGTCLTNRHDVALVMNSRGFGEDLGMGQNYSTRMWTTGFSHRFHLPGQAILG